MISNFLQDPVNLMVATNNRFTWFAAWSCGPPHALIVISSIMLATMNDGRSHQCPWCGVYLAAGGASVSGLSWTAGIVVDGALDSVGAALFSVTRCFAQPETLEKFAHWLSNYNVIRRQSGILKSWNPSIIVYVDELRGFHQWTKCQTSGLRRYAGRIYWRKCKCIY